MRRSYSRLESVEEKRNTRKAVVFVLLSLIIVVFLATNGLSLITKVINFASSFKKNPQTIEFLDKTPPSPPFLQSIPDATNVSPFEITGRVELENTVVINFNSKEEEIQTDENGNFSAKFELIKGDNTFFAYTKNPAGNKSQDTKKYVLVFDNEVPDIKILTPSDGTSFYGSRQKNVTINGTTKIDSSLTINDRIATVGDDGGFSLSYSLSNGENNLIIKSVDKAGNEKEISLKLFFNE
ncbi:MAG: hypothetical protein NTV24_01020 [Candidatus Woesebacteria bacterium]|nr:hypothetical protein [Candidatus Woesebacteria bacterium]